MKMRFLQYLCVSFVCSFLIVCLVNIPAGAETQYSFNYYFNNGSGDYFTGYVYAPDGWFTTGSTITNQPSPMGGAALAGYYYITDATTGLSSSYDKQEYITAFYDTDTGKSSTTFYTSTSQTTSTHPLYVADRSTTSESGYVYDPSVPSTDAFFGDPDVCYPFSTASSSNPNFLAGYVSLPYWKQPSTYPYSSAEVAAAIGLSFWDSHGYSNLISTNWQSEWPDNTSNISSYVSLIADLCSRMKYSSSNGTNFLNAANGLVGYAAAQGYNFTYAIYDATIDPNGAVAAGKKAAAAGRPVGLEMYWGSLGNFTSGAFACGYWNNDYILVNLGYGTSYKNIKMYMHNQTPGYSPEQAVIYTLVDCYPY